MNIKISFILIKVYKINNKICWNFDLDSEMVLESIKM